VVNNTLKFPVKPQSNLNQFNLIFEQTPQHRTLTFPVKTLTFFTHPPRNIRASKPTRRSITRITLPPTPNPTTLFPPKHPPLPEPRQTFQPYVLTVKGLDFSLLSMSLTMVLHRLCHIHNRPNHMHNLPNHHPPKNPKHTPQNQTKTNTHLKSHLADVKI